MSMRNRWKWLFIAPAALAGIALLMALVAFIGGEIVMRLWNWLVPPIFGWRQVNFWQALGLLVLCRVLFGGHVYRSRAHRRTPEERENGSGGRFANAAVFRRPGQTRRRRYCAGAGVRPSKAGTARSSTAPARRRRGRR